MSRPINSYAADELVIALESGSAWAYSLKPGDTFLGSLVEARQRYPEDDILQRLFSFAALNVLEQHVIETTPGPGGYVLFKYELRSGNGKPPQT